MVDLSGAPTETSTPIEYQLTGPIGQIFKRRSWQEGAVAARGQCCILALYCAKMHHEWSTRSSLEPQVVSGITDLKRSIRDAVQTNPAFLGQYNPRWMQRLTDTSKASEETVEAFIDSSSAGFLRHTQRRASINWIGAGTRRSLRLQRSDPGSVPPMFVCGGFMPGQEDIEKTPIPVGNWTTIFITLPAPTFCSFTNAEHTLTQYISPPTHEHRRYRPRVGESKPLPNFPVPAGLLTTPINEAAQLEPLLEQFPLTARSMIWEVGTPEIASLHKKPELTGLLDTWKEDIVRAASVDAAVQLATNQPRWGELLARAETPPSVIVLRALTAITAIQ
ncbi:hypothetical protein DYB36_012157 [Aphanomyces astaci]|uniref:Uncharacterized protein n=1 Tax=Aphanomyces astaci TaxID=112090 RepID=A0A397BP67_APHAT|nr:hypothetical protein DYB36_012157 [Aphanomyces astaci]